MSLTIPTLLERGYFPQELPPPFTSQTFASFVSHFAGKPLPFDTKTWRTSRPESFNLARTGTLRRELSILNPIHFAILAELVVTKWIELEQATKSSAFSMTGPNLADPNRAIGRMHPMNARSEKRASCYARGKYLLRADISRFYSSIYTHSIPWALHGKLVSKQNKKKRVKLLGDRLDEAVRNCQDAQTTGIPIGPDTSLLIAEIILSQVDERLKEQGVKGLRYVDDYELVFETELQASEGLARFQKTLIEFELHLNPSKTKILPLPQRLEEDWVDELRSFRLVPAAPSFGSQLIHFFDTAFDLAADNPGFGVLKYAAGRIARIRKWPRHYNLAEDLLVQCARAEAGALPVVLNTLLRSSTDNIEQKDRRRNLFLQTITEHAPLRHSSEVAWSIWACIVEKFVIPQAALKMVVDMEDSVCALLALHARAAGLTETGPQLDLLQSALVIEELYDARWMLAYEAIGKGWLPPPNGRDYTLQDPNFSALRSTNVTFYDSTKVMLPALPPLSPVKFVIPEDTQDMENADYEAVDDGGYY